MLLLYQFSSDNIPTVRSHVVGDVVGNTADDDDDANDDDDDDDDDDEEEDDDGDNNDNDDDDDDNCKINNPYVLLIISNPNPSGSQIHHY